MKRRAKALFHFMPYMKRRRRSRRTKHDLQDLKALEFMVADVPHILKSEDLLKLEYLRRKCYPGIYDKKRLMKI